VSTPAGSQQAGLAAARAGLRGARAWLVGGAVRDRMLGRATCDLDVVVDGDPRRAARSIAAAAASAASFPLSEEFGSWRVVARDGTWQVDVEPLRGGSIDTDLRLRDLTVNAIAEPLQGGEPIDPLGGAADIAAGILRAAGEGAFGADPLRVLRLVRAAVELGMEPEAQTLAAARAQAAALETVSPERIFAELRRIVACPRAVDGLEMVSSVGAGRVVLPELELMRGVEQNRFHHLDVHGHTMEVLQRTIDLQGPSGPFADVISGCLRASADGVRELLAEPLADEMSRGEALRWGALLHDAAKPLTLARSPADGRVTFIGHDELGAQLAREVLGRLRASERLRAHVAGLVRSHLRLGFLVHQPQPLDRRIVYRYMTACEPVPADVTLLSIADRLATRGDSADRAIEAHLALASGVLADALAWRREGPPRPPIRGDELARALGMEPGPELGRLLGALAEDSYAAGPHGREQAIARARELLENI